MSSAIRATASYSKDMARKALSPGAPPTTPWRDREAGDDYGASASPNWRETNWARRAETGRDRRHPDQLRRRGIARLARARRARARPRRAVAELAREHPAAGPGAARARARPARPRAHAEAGRWRDQHPGLRALRGRVLRAARPRQGRARGELDGRLRGGRGGDPVPGAGLAARTGLGRRHLLRRRPSRADPDDRPARLRDRDKHRRARPRAGVAADHPPRLTRTRGAPSQAAEAGPGLRGPHQGRGQAGLQRRPARLPRLRLPRPAART